MPGLPEDLERLLHDLRGPLNSAVIHLEVLKRIVGSDGRESVQAIHGELVRLAEMLGAAFNVLALERTGFARINLRALVEATLRDEHLEGVALAAAPWPDVQGDERLLSLAVAHLVRNALEATSGARPPEVGAALRADGDVELVVTNWGAGNNPRPQNPRPRLHGSTKGGHRGIGLVTVLRIARLHGGTLRFDRVDGATEARLTLRKAAPEGARRSAKTV